MSAGRPPDEAPPGHKTVSETAAILGISPSAVRQQIRSGRLPFMPDENGEPVRTQSGARRYYIPEPAVRAELERRRRLATGGDVERVQREVETRTTEIIESQFREIMEHEERVIARIEALEGQGVDRGEQFERVLESAERLEGIESKLQEILEELKGQRRARRPWWQRWFSAA